MLKIELPAYAVILTIIWLGTVIYAIAEGGQPPSGLVVTISTVTAAAAWLLLWARYVCRQLQEMRNEVGTLREERDVSDAMRRIRRLRLINYDDEGHSHG